MTASTKQLFLIANLINDNYPIIKQELVGEHFSSYSAVSNLANIFKGLTIIEASELITALKEDKLATIEDYINEVTAKQNVNI